MNNNFGNSKSVVNKRPFDLSTLFPYFFIFPAVAIMVAGLLYPVIQAFYLSFYDWKIGTDFNDAPYVGLRHFIRMVGDENVILGVFLYLVRITNVEK